MSWRFGRVGGGRAFSDFRLKDLAELGGGRSAVGGGGGIGYHHLADRRRRRRLRPLRPPIPQLRRGAPPSQ